MSAPLKSTYLEAPGSFSSDRIIAVITTRRPTQTGTTR